MYLKEAFRYQNLLNRLIDQTIAFLSTKANVTIVTQEHYRKKANPEAEDETMEVERNRGLEYDNNKVIEFLEHLLDEKTKLTAAVSRAKAACGFDLDAELANNRIRQRVAECLAGMSRIRPEEKKTSGRSFKFNADGEQVSYAYDVKQVVSIDFDRNKVRTDSAKYVKDADEISAKIDRLMVDVEVEYDPEFAPGDGLEDAITAWAEAKA